MSTNFTKNKNKVHKNKTLGKKTGQTPERNRKKIKIQVLECNQAQNYYTVEQFHMRKLDLRA